MTIAIMTILLMILVFLGVPITWSLGFTGFVGLLILGSNPLTLIPQSIYNGVVYFPLLAIPFYIFAGEIMNKGGITKKLVDLSSLIVGRVQGSLAYVNILCSMFFGGITGSAVADTSSIGSMLIPAMKTQGYKEDEAVAVTVSSSIMGPIIPPSIIMVIYGSIMSINIGALFMGGIIPGILIGVALAIVVAIRNRMQHFPVRTEKYTPAERKSILLNALIPLGMPIVIMGGILGGIFTATEAGCVAVIYSFIVSVFVLKTVKLKELRGMLLSTAKTTGTVLIIIGCSKTLSWSLTLLQVQQSLTYFFSTTISSSIVFLIVVNILYLIIGCFMEPAAALIMFSPLLGPIAVHYGINPILFGLISCINLNIGNATPPLGQCLFVGCKIGQLSLGRVAKSIMPYLAAEIAVLLLVTYIPDISLILPRIAGLTS
jgi:tripartite ATP-independent transporter DctM subunit